MSQRIPSSSMPFLTFSRMLVFQLSNFVTWSNSKTAPVNVSTSPPSTASARMLTNLASLVEGKVVSREPYFDRLRFAVTVSYGVSVQHVFRLKRSTRVHD